MKQIRKFPICGNPVLPAIYGETLSYAEEMGRVKQGFNDMVDNIEELEDRVEEAEGTVESFDGRMSTAEGDIDNLEQRADGVDSQIGDIQEQIGNNTLGVSVPKYNADFQDHEYELSGTLASLEDGMVGLVQKACPVPNDNDPSETDPAIIYRAKVHGWDEVKSDISGLQEKLGNNTVKTSVPRYNVQFTDHEYEIVDEHDDIYEGLEDGQVALLQKECPTPNDSDPTEKFPELLTATKVKGWEKVVTDERVWGLTEVEGNPITLEVVQENEAKGAVVKFEPKQNLNGYEYPWAGGANVNKAGFHTGGYVDATGAKVQNSQYGMTDVITLTDNLYLDRGTAEHFGYAIFSDAECTTMTSRGEAGTEADSIAYNLPSGTTAYVLCWWDLGSGVTASQSAMDTAHCEATIGTQATEWTPWANVCPIEGWTQLKVNGVGKNLATALQIWQNAPNLTQVTKDGRSCIRFNCGSNSMTDVFHCFKELTRYHLSFDVKCEHISGQVPTVQSRYLAAYYTDGSYNYWGTSGTTDSDWTRVDVTSNEEKTLERFGVRTSEYRMYIYIDINSVQLEEGNVRTEYKPYAISNNITVALGQTVYGGELDVVKGECKVIYRNLILTGYEKTWSTYQSTQYHYQLLLESEYDNLDYAFCYSNMFKWKQGNNDPSNENCEVFSADGRRIRFKLMSCNDLTEFVNFVKEQYNNGTPITVCYELTTPIVITGLTPAQISLLEGVNTLWTDGSSLDVLYVSDIATIKQLNDKLAETIGDIAGTEYETATSNHSVNDFIIFNGGFYKVISAITAGDTLVVGTNIRKTTIGAEVSDILNLGNYNSTEKVVGTWYDGRPIYRKTVSGLNVTTSSNWVSTGITIQNIAQVIKCSGTNTGGKSAFNCNAGVSGSTIEVCIPGWSTTLSTITVDYIKNI